MISPIQIQKIAFFLIRLMAATVVLILLTLLIFLIYKGIGVISWEFLTAMPKAGMTAGGILPAIVGTLILTLLGISIAMPVGLGAAIYLAEFAKNDWKYKFILLMTNNLAGIPSIVFGLFGMALFVQGLGMGDSILAGACTLALVVLPVIIRTSEEALKAVPKELKLASIGLGATRMQTLFKVLLPVAAPRVLTGLILSMGRISGETAPILFTVAAYFLPRLPTSIFDQVMALPYHLYVISTSGTNIDESRPMAYGTALVLMALVCILNIIAFMARRYFTRKSPQK
jgi:phosphate transport system permease protein